MCSIIKVALTKKRLESNGCSFLNLFSTSKCFNLFEVTFLLKFICLSSKSVFFTKAAISFSIGISLLAKFACANFAAKVSAANVLNSALVIHLSWLWSVIFFPILLIFVL